MTLNLLSVFLNQEEFPLSDNNGLVRFHAFCLGLGKKFWPPGFDYVLQDPVPASAATPANSGTRKRDIPSLIVALKQAGNQVTDELYVISVKSCF